MTVNARTQARWTASYILKYHNRGDVSLMRIVEELDEYELFKDCAFSTLEGAVRAAARELDRRVYVDRGDERIEAAT